MTTNRLTRIDTTANPPMRYLVAEGCPKPPPKEGPFHACACYGPAVPEQGKPSVQVSCEFLRRQGFFGDELRDFVECAHGEAPNTGSGVQFGIPIVRHATQQEDDGSHPD